MKSFEDEVVDIIAQELQKGITNETIFMLNGTEPKLVFRKTDDPLVLEYSMAYYPGCFTPTGMRDHHIEPVAKWCFDNSCGIISKFPYHIEFKSEAEVAWFLLTWS